MFVEGDTPTVKSWELERIVDKRYAARGSEYLVRWKGYGKQYDEWRDLPEMENAMELVQDYEQAMTSTTFLPGRQIGDGSHLEKLSGTSDTPSKPKQRGRPRKANSTAIVLRRTEVAGESTPPKRKRGRPRKQVTDSVVPTNLPKRKRGRPRKYASTAVVLRRA